MAYERLKSLLGVPGHRTRMTTFMSTALVEPAVLDAIDGDIILLGSKMCPARMWGPGSARDWKDVTLWGHHLGVPQAWEFRTDANGTVHWEPYGLVCPAGGMFFDAVTGFFDPSDPGAVPELRADEYQPPVDLPDEYLRALEESARWLHENSDFSITCGEVITDLQIKVGGFGPWWIRLAEDPDSAFEYLAKACDAGLSQLRVLDQAVGKYCDILMIADDIGDMRGVTIGPDLWREVYKPHYQRLFAGWHEITDMKIHLHSCGSIYDVIGDLVECGLDILNPVQISAHNMAPERLKAEFGDRLIFYGGAFDAVNTPASTPAREVFEATKRNIQTLARGGGYIFAGVHNITGDTPESHLRAMLEAYRHARAYPPGGEN
jgi:uroporphyrinogen decarboxylase